MNFFSRPSAPVRARTLMCLLPLALLGCANFSADGGLNRISALTRERIGYAAPDAPNSPEVKERLNVLLSAPLTSDAAVEMALLSNPRLRVAFAELGIAEAALCAGDAGGADCVIRAFRLDDCLVTARLRSIARLCLI